MCLMFKIPTVVPYRRSRSFLATDFAMIQNQLSENDLTLLGRLNSCPDMTIGQMVDEMGVTATAVRQRLTKLMAMGLVNRSHAAEGRGRPSHQYALTDKGRKSCANNLGDLAVALWEEVQKINDEETRRRVISGAVERLAEKYETEISGRTLEDRMASVTAMFAERNLPVSFGKQDGLPVIKVSGCPYPTLADGNREICDMEQELLGRILGQPLDRCQCEQDGDRCCSFQTTQAIEAVTQEQLTTSD